MLIDESLSGQTRDGSQDAFAVSRAIIERVLKEGGAILSNDASRSVICVGLEAFDSTKRDLIEEAFARAVGDYKQAGAILGLSPLSLYPLLKNLKLTHLLK